MSLGPLHPDAAAPQDRLAKSSPAARTAARALPLPQAQPAGRGSPDEPLSPGQGRRRSLRQPGPGGGLDRHRLRSRPRRRRRAADPQPRRHAGARRLAARGLHPVHGARHESHRRQGLQPALRGLEARPDLADLDARGARAGDGRSRSRLEAPASELRRHDLHRRRRYLHRRLSRRNERRGGAGRPAGRHRGAQRLRLFDPHRAAR